MAEKKEYRSAIRSRRLIRQAFLELLKEKKFEKITVTDIVKRADINRSTFYAHYPDVLGLVEELINEVVDRSLDLANKMDIRDIFRDPLPFISQLMSIGLENMEIYSLLGRSDFALRQVEEMKKILLKKVISEVDLPESIRHNTSFQVRSCFFIGGILSIYQLWINGELDCSMEDIAQELVGLLQGSYLDIFQAKI